MGCFSLDFFIHLHSVSLDIWLEDGLSILNMNPGDNPEGSFPGLNPPPGGEPGSGGGTQPGGSGGPQPGGPGGSGGPSLGGSNTGSLSQTPGDQNISSPPYDPSGSVPPTTNYDLYRLIQYKFAYQSDLSGLSSASVARLFGKDTAVNNIAKQLLYAHILDHKEDLHTAFNQLDPFNHSGK